MILPAAAVAMPWLFHAAFAFAPCCRHSIALDSPPMLMLRAAAFEAAITLSLPLLRHFAATVDSFRCCYAITPRYLFSPPLPLDAAAAAADAADTRRAAAAFDITPRRRRHAIFSMLSLAARPPHAR
jgi:hypothetical protein